MSTPTPDHLYHAVVVGGGAACRDRDLGLINDCDH